MTEAALEVETEEEIPEVVVELSPEEKQYEDRARRQGWRPKEQYSGDPARWVDAKTFVLRGEAELPLIRERFRKMDTEFASVKTELTATKKQLNEASEVLVELRDMSRSAEDRAYKRAMSELQAKQREAVREASEEKYEAAQREMDQLPKPAAPPVPKKKEETTVRTDAAPPAVLPNPAYISWVSENPWFNSDRMLNVVAIEEEKAIQSEYPGMSVTDQLAEVKQRVMDRFPEKFGNKRRATPAAVAISAAPPAKAKGKTVKDLPPDAKAALAKFKSQIPGYKDEDYLKMYFGDEAAE